MILIPVRNLIPVPYKLGTTTGFGTEITTMKTGTGNACVTVVIQSNMTLCVSPYFLFLSIPYVDRYGVSLHGPFPSRRMLIVLEKFIYSRIKIIGP